MSITLLHQVGHNANWNLDSFQIDDCGDGLIFSPVHQNIDSVRKAPPEVRARSLFDPQYYLPNSQKAKLNSYDFFPETLLGGFSTTGFGAVARESAKRCLAFQLEQGFAGIVIPARHFEEMNPDYTDDQQAYTVDPFLSEITKARVDQRIWLTLPMTAAMVLHVSYRTKILNWVTSFPEIFGVYLIVEFERETKQIQSKDFLSAQLEFLRQLRSADLEVIVGHCNTEGLLYSLIDGCAITFGAFENTRMFSVDKFVSSLEDRRGPRARMYLNGLLNWVQYVQAKEISSKANDLWRNIYKANEYGDDALSSPTEPHFNQPALYKHFFLAFESQVKALGAVSQSARYGLLRAWIKAAIDFDEELKRRYFDLERHGRGDHLQPWLDAINSYYRSYLA